MDNSNTAGDDVARSLPPRGRMGRPDRRTQGAERHQARARALQILYEVDATDHPFADVVAHTPADDEVPPPVARHAEQLARGAWEARDEIDTYISAAAPAFPVAQLPGVDRNVLRLAIYEMLHAPDVPTKVAINEAIELGKRFGGPSSGRFVNGVLGTVAERVRPDDGGGKASRKTSSSS